MNKILLGVGALGLSLTAMGDASEQFGAGQPGRLNAQAESKNGRTGPGKAVPITGHLSGTVELSGPVNMKRQGQLFSFATTVSAAGTLSGVGQVEATLGAPNL